MLHNCLVLPFWTSASLAVQAADFFVKAAVLALMTRDENVSGVVGQVLNIPVTCHPKSFPADKYEYGSYQQNKDGSVVDAPKMDWFWEQYLPNAEPDVYASPLLAKDLSKLPAARKCLK
jgi:acetyl esterase/lipase